jgi:hypothetical protein
LAGVGFKALALVRLCAGRVVRSRCVDIDAHRSSRRTRRHSHMARVRRRALDIRGTRNTGALVANVTVPARCAVCHRRQRHGGRARLESRGTRRDLPLVARRVRRGTVHGHHTRTGLALRAVQRDAAVLDYLRAVRFVAISGANRCSRAAVRRLFLTGAGVRAIDARIAETAHAFETDLKWRTRCIRIVCVRG